MASVEMRAMRLAVLIDADNASADIAQGLFDEIAGLGEANVRRIYGDFSSPRISGWTKLLQRFAIEARQEFAYTKGKNASDIALVIDAMDLLHSGRFDGFCLVSSDSDFTRLAMRIRDENVAVFGFGEKKTPESFRQACKRFIFTENLLPRPAAAATGTERTPLEPLAEAGKILARVVGEIEGDGGWVNLGQLGTEVRKRLPDFDERTYGFKKLTDLVKKIDAFEVAIDGGGRVRLKPKAGRAKKQPAKR